jgi:glycosyltransferase involved in cell wall biosynthesis
MLEGEDGRQVKELDRLVDWLLAEKEQTSVVCLSNVLLAGMARRIKDRLGVPVVCLLQDEDGFLDGLGSPYAEQAWEIVRRRARDFDGFIAVSTYFGRTMQERLEVDSSLMHVVHMGIDLDAYDPAESAPTVPTIGFLSRMCPDRGLETLVDAFIAIKKKEGLKSAKLRVSGGRSIADEPFIEQLRGKLEAAGVLDDAEFLEAFDVNAKFDFLRSLSVMAVPEKAPVAYGLYVLEALAMGVPVVEPAMGCFPETIEMTGGGVLYESNTVEGLVEAMTPLLTDKEAARRLGAEGRDGLRQNFSVVQTAEKMIRTCERIAGQS